MDRQPEEEPKGGKGGERGKERRKAEFIFLLLFFPDFAPNRPERLTSYELWHTFGGGKKTRMDWRIMKILADGSLEEYFPSSAIFALESISYLRPRFTVCLRILAPSEERARVTLRLATGQTEDVDRLSLGRRKSGALVPLLRFPMHCNGVGGILQILAGFSKVIGFSAIVASGNVQTLSS